MQRLIQTALDVQKKNNNIPYSIFSFVNTQEVLNVPIIKPLLICVLDGVKKISGKNNITCTTGNFIFLSNSFNVNMRNIPAQEQYFAVAIEFDYKDFDCFEYKPKQKTNYCLGNIDPLLENTIYSFCSGLSLHHLTSGLFENRRSYLLYIKVDTSR